MSPARTRHRRPPLQQFAQRRRIGRWIRFATRDVWHVQTGELGRPRSVLVQLARVLLIAGRGFQRDDCLQRSAALTYLTIFTLPPVLALVFSVAKGLNAYESLKEGPIDAFLDATFPAEESGSARVRALIDQIFDYVQRADLTVLSSFAALFLIWATIKMLSAVEDALNGIWGVQRPRSLVRKFSDYLAIVLLTPFVLIAGTSFTAFLQSTRLQRMLSEEGALSPFLALIPFATICLGMSVIFLTMPNTRVRFLPALAGGLAAGALWQLAQFGFVRLQVGLARQDAIFSGFAAFPLLLMWIYASWIAFFVGAELCYAVQNVQLVTRVRRTGVVDQRFREAIAPRLSGRIVAAFLAGEDPPTAARLASELGLSPRAVTDVLETLVRHRLLAETSEEEEEGYLPARDPSKITVLDLLHALRREPDSNPITTLDRLDERVDRILHGFDEELRRSLYNDTLEELARHSLEGRAPARERPPLSEPRTAENPSGP